MQSCLSLAFLAASLIPTVAQSTPPTSVSADMFKATPLPFSFKYDGKDSASFLPSWQNTDDPAAAPDGQIHRYTYKDPATKLKVVAEVRTFKDFDAVDWVLTFTNEGTADTPIIEDIQPLHWTIGCDSPGAALHCARGSDSQVEDFTPIDTDLPPNGKLLIGTGSGRSSDNGGAPGGNSGSFPFFNLQTGGHGIYGAIGWTGNWIAHFNRSADTGKTIDLDAGMLKTHLLLHPGETIRSPRILLMNWKGDMAEAQNTWRQLMIAEYSPKDLKGKTVTMPICWDTWGTEFASVKLKVIQGMAEQKIPADLYWIDAGWYEPLSLTPGQSYNVGSDWAGNRGDWIMSKNLYPDGMKPLGEALKAAGIGFLLWVEAETASTNAHRVKEHPDWYVGKGDPMFLNLGNPEAFKAITDQVSGIITDNELTWYRQDFNFSPAGYWASADAPDRIGMSEIKSITGLYAYWDKLRELHPGLQIDNCASGGRRLDIETMSRSVSLWRSDNAGDPIGEQYHTVGLMPWEPLTAGVWITLKGQGPAIATAEQIYQQRSGYGAGMTVCIDQTPAPWIKTAFDEFHEVRPYYLENFCPLLPPNRDGASWAAWQLQKRDGKSGLIVALRRPGSPYPQIQLDLRAIDGAAQYDVEVRYGLEKGKVQTLSGNDLAHYTLTIPDRPGSALVFYAKH